ncbi:MAG TPA: tetratricopeptide repeat protein [Fibrobacteria bacterium]|nr:tetratricopeptide repeat protein [Fibrobacteria bacterium]
MKTARTAVFAASTLLAGHALALDYSKTRYQQTDYFGDFGQNTPLFINPGNITDADQTEIMLGMYSTVNGQAGLEYVSGVAPIGLKQTIGATMFINGATVDAPDEQTAPGTSKAWRKDAIMLGYGYRVLHWATLGANIQVLNFNNFGDKSNPFAMDLGLLLNPFQDSKAGFLKLGAAVQNAYQQPGFDNTRNLNFGLHWLGLGRSLAGRAEFSIIDFGGDQPQKAWAVGAQYYLSPNVALGGKITREGFPMITFAGNAQRLSLLRYLEIELDVSHDGISWEDKKRGLIWNVKLTTRVGPTREEFLGAKRYWRLIREPEERFREAMQLYLQRRFVESAYAFGRVVVKYPTFQKADIATYYQGKSLENLQMHAVAKKVYNTGIQNFGNPENKYPPKFYFQLLNIAYKDGNWADAQTNYNIIASQYRGNEIKADADYVMGQAYFAQGKNSEARGLLESIGQDDANYAYARYTLGLINTQEGKLPEAQQDFESILTRNPRNKSEKDLQEGAAVKLGHVLYSLPTPQLSKALELYNQIPSNSQYYDEAQLAAAWCFVRNATAQPKFWDDAVKRIDNYTKNDPTSILVPEGWLVKGYSQLSRKDCKTAVTSFQTVQQLLGKGFLTQEEIQKKTDEWKAGTADLPEVSEKVYQLTLQLPSERVLDKRAAVQPNINRILAAQEEYFKFQDIMNKQKKFEKDKARLEKDATYALATAQKCLETQPTGPSF